MIGMAMTERQSERPRTDELPEMIGRRAVIILFVSLAMALPEARAAVPRRAQQSDPPDLHITRVRRLAAIGVAATAEIEVRWTAQVPRLTVIDGFDAGLEVFYTDGSKNSFSSNSLRPSARTAIFKVPTHPRQSGTADLKRFKASIRINFKITSRLTLTHEFTVEPQTGRLQSKSGRSSGDPIEISIAEARLTNQGCASGEQCIDVKWTATAARNLSFTGFEVKAEALHKDGARRSASASTGGTGRQTRLTLKSGGSAVTSASISLFAGMASSDSVTITQDGAF